VWYVAVVRASFGDSAQDEDLAALQVDLFVPGDLLAGGLPVAELGCGGHDVGDFADEPVAVVCHGSLLSWEVLWSQRLADAHAWQ
jgi:hypothetical protein